MNMYKIVLVPRKRSGQHNTVFIYRHIWEQAQVLATICVPYKGKIPFIFTKLVITLFQ